MARYYPSDYPSFELKRGDYENAIKRMVRRLRDRYAFYDKGLIGRLIHEWFPYPGLRSLSALGLTKDMRILDVGCGSAVLLCSLRDLGFKNLVGVDAYIENELNYPDGVRVLRKTIHDIQAQFDLVMLHHVFEHVPCPGETLKEAAKLLPSGGICLIRIPVVDCWAWEYYGVHWYAIDAPRHFFLHSKKSMALLAEEAGFKIRQVVYDSAESQFWLSEDYKKGIPWYREGAHGRYRRKPSFSMREMRVFKKKAVHLNLEGKGDQAAFHLEKL
jgi:2-polyprenyl-3-methyl-5-hydroxy-6-metoxy-1,4-benzoquinol methylase